MPKRQKFSIHAPCDEILMYDPHLESGRIISLFSRGAMSAHTDPNKEAAQADADRAADLSEFAGQEVDVKLEGAATGWAWEFGYWGGITLE